MDTEKDRNVQEFKDLLAKWKDAYHQAVSSYIAIKTPDGPKLILSRVIFETGAIPLTAQPFLLETEKIIGSRVIQPITSNTLDNLINDAATGKLTVAGKTFMLPLGATESISGYFSPLYHPSFRVESNPRLPSLQMGGGSMGAFLSKANFSPYEYIDWSLKAADKPFFNLEELLLYLGLPSLRDRGEFTTLELIAMSPVGISDDSRILDNEALIKCRVAKALDPKGLKLGYKIPHKDKPEERSFLTGESFEWKEEGIILIGSAKISVGDAPILQTFLSYNGETLHQLWVTDPQKRLNSRQAIYEAFDLEMGIVKKFVDGLGQNKGSDFAHGVAQLLHILGFSVIQHGLTKPLEDGPDLIAVTPIGHIAVIECTTGLLNEKDKLAKLANRTEVIRAKLEAAGYGYITVQPVIVSSLPRSRVEAHVQEAHRNRIAVVCKEELDELFAQVKLPPNAEVLFQRAVQSVPKRDQPSLFPE